MTHEKLRLRDSLKVYGNAKCLECGRAPDSLGRTDGTNVPARNTRVSIGPDPRYMATGRLGTPFIPVNPMTRLQRALATFLLGAAPAVGHSQNAPVESPRRVYSLGLMALGDLYEGDGVGASAEWRVANLSRRFSLALGGMTGVQKNSEPFNGNMITNTTVPLLAIANVRFQRATDSRLQLYTGISTGATQVFVSGYPPASGLPDESGTHFAFGAQIGMRYRVVKNAGLMLQVGVGDNPGVFGGLSIRR